MRDGQLMRVDPPGVVGHLNHMLDADYLSTWYPKRAGERRAFLERIGKAVPFWLGTPSPP